MDKVSMQSYEISQYENTVKNLYEDDRASRFYRKAPLL
jgi:hypothetical protein